MPYGIAKKAGGDSPSNVSKMERCVADLKAQGKSEQSAIRICKVAIQRRAMKQQGR